VLVARSSPVLAAVGLDDEAVLGPEEVGGVETVEERDLAARQRETRAGDERQHRLLEVVGRDARLVVGEGLDGGVERAAATAGRRVDGGDVEQAQKRRAVDDALELVGREDVGEVDEGARDRGDGEAVIEERHVESPIQGAALMDANRVLGAASGGAGDVDRGQ
jgi:hypothetical protein